MAEKKSRTSFIISIVILITGMTIGFLLLGIVYTGPVWVRVVVFLVYLFVVGMTVHFSRKYVNFLKK